MGSLDLSRSQERWIALVLGMVLVALIVFLISQDDDVAPQPLPSRQDERPAREEAVESATPAPNRHAPSVITKIREDEVEVETPAKVETQEAEEAEETETPTSPLDCLALKKGNLSITIADRLGAPSVDFILILRPMTGVDDRFHSRAVKVSSGNTLIEGLAAVTWELRMAGDSERLLKVAILPDSTVNESIETSRMRFKRLQIKATTTDETAISNLRLGTFCPGDCNRLIEICQVPVETGNIDLSFVTAMEEIVVLADGWEPIYLSKLRSQALFEASDPRGPSVQRLLFKPVFKNESRYVRGRVISEDGNPINGSQVIYSPGDTRATAIGNAARNSDVGGPPVERRVVVAHCDTDGRFAIQVPAGISGHLQARSPGFESSRLMSFNSRNPDAKLEFSLRKARPIVGTTENIPRGLGQGPGVKDPRWLHRRHRARLNPTIKEWFGPLDDDLMRIAPARDGSFLIECAPLLRFGLASYVDTGSASASRVWTVESDHPEDQVVPVY